MEEAEDLVAVPRRLLAEILADGTCPLHLRLELRRAMSGQAYGFEEEDIGSITAAIKPCLPLIAAKLPLAEVLSVRACSSAGLEWVMQRSVERLGGAAEAHDRIRTRLWIQRVADLNRESADETVYETPVRRLADDALRRRMEAEMADARHDMEQQIRAFQVEVDRRMEQQAVRVHAIVEERVQQQLDTILVAEMEKVRAMVEERVQGRVRAVVQREVHATVCEMQVRQAMLAHENERLRAALLEQLDHSDLCFRSLVWALSPNATGFFARTLRLMWTCRRRFTHFSAWLLGVPPDRRREGLRARLETELTGGAAPPAREESEEPRAELQSLLAPAAERELPELPQSVRRQLLMAIVAAAAALPADARAARSAARGPQRALAGEEAAPAEAEVREEAAAEEVVAAEDEEGAESPHLSEPEEEEEEEARLAEVESPVPEEDEEDLGLQCAESAHLEADREDAAAWEAAEAAAPALEAAAPSALEAPEAPSPAASAQGSGEEPPEALEESPPPTPLAPADAPPSPAFAPAAAEDSDALASEASSLEAADEAGEAAEEGAAPVAPAAPAQARSLLERLLRLGCRKRAALS